MLSRCRYDIKKNSIFLSTLKCCSPPLIYNNPNIMTVKPTLMCDLWQLCHPSSWFVPENSWKSKPSSIFFLLSPYVLIYKYIDKEPGRSKMSWKVEILRESDRFLSEKVQYALRGRIWPFHLPFRKADPTLELGSSKCVL